VIEDKVRGFIIDELQFDGSQGRLTADFPLLEQHVIDSLGLFQLVGYLESEFGIEILDEELVPEHFGTLRGIARLVESKSPRD
jgi:acyl carrier protein